ncbi:MAG: DUF2218 domain-containing protein [Acetobacteraceae bacterium]|nr:DUF2218 domain-containing protein [Acetobacteraceae bacterium]
MPAIHARVQTDHASRYLQQLCKHWSHRFAVEFDPAHGVIHLTGADCILDADSDALRMELRATDPEMLPRMGDVVAEHLKRFAFREELSVAWSATPEA